MQLVRIQRLRLAEVIMAKGKDVWTAPNPDGKGWESREVGEDGKVVIKPTKKEAVLVGREMARANKSEHVITKKDGTIQNKNSYGNDPRNIKG